MSSSPLPHTMRPAPPRAQLAVTVDAGDEAPMRGAHTQTGRMKTIVARLAERLHFSPGARFAGALLTCAWIIAAAPVGLDQGAYATLAVAACAGAIIALHQRGIAGVTALGLIGIALLQAKHAAHPNLLVPIAMLTSAALIGRVLMPRVPTRGWPLILFVVALTLKLSMNVGGSIAVAALLITAVLVAHASFEITRQLGAGNDIVGSLNYSLTDRLWLADTSRYLLLGRIAGGMAHELSQAMNVIGMANGNMSYILARANLPEPFNTELNQRVGKIAAHSSNAATMLGQFRWFGQDGGRDGTEMTVGTALERAVMVTRSATRKTGVVVEIRGDALAHPVPLRHGLIEMLASTALSELARMLADRPSESKPPQAIVLEATRTEAHVEIAVVCRSDTPLPHAQSDGIDQITYDLVSRLAASVRAEIRRMEPHHHPVRFRLRLPRDII